MMTYINLKPKASITQKGKILGAFSLRSGIRQGYTLLPLLLKNCCHYPIKLEIKAYKH